MRAALLAIVLLFGCSRSDEAAKHRLFARDEGGGATRAFDPAHPEVSLALEASEVAGRLGSFEWTGAVDWSVSRAYGSPLHVTEQHLVRQAATGEFEVRADVDPGLGPSAVQGKEIRYVGGMTYARALPAPFRERPTDHGRDARRFREDSFGLVRSVAAMIGPGLRIQPDGGEVVLGREVLRYRFSLGQATRAAPSAAPAGFQASDSDTALRQGFLRGSVPRSVEGELAVDAETGAPMRARLSASFDADLPQAVGAGGASGGAGVDGEEIPGGRSPVAMSVVVSGQVKALGGEVKAITPPDGALPDERKPSGPSTALEAAGLKKRGEVRQQAPEPADEGD